MHNLERSVEAGNELASFLPRADLPSHVILGALRHRTTETGRDLSEDELIAALRAGDREITELLQTVELPAPSAPVAMPMQQLLAPSRREARSLFGRPVASQN